MTDPAKTDEIGELRAEMAELRALLRLTIKRTAKRRRDIAPDAPPSADERRREIRAVVLGKLGKRRREK